MDRKSRIITDHKHKLVLNHYKIGINLMPGRPPTRTNDLIGQWLKPWQCVLFTMAYSSLLEMGQMNDERQQVLLHSLSYLTLSRVNKIIVNFSEKGNIKNFQIALQGIRQGESRNR